MTTPPIASVWSELQADLLNVNIVWQLLTIALCVVLAWVLARVVRPSLAADTGQQRLVRLGVESFVPVLWPVLALFLVYIAKFVLAQWQSTNLLRLAVPLIGSFALIRFAFYILHRIFARGGAAGSSLLLFERVFAILVWIGFALYILGLWEDTLALLEGIVLPIGSNKVSVLVILQAVVFIALTLILALWAGATLEERLMGIESMHSSLRVVLARMGKAVLILIAILVSLSLVGMDLTVLSVFGGAIGVGLGLGLQKIVSSYVSGFVILIERSLTIGDVITVDKYSGRVARINTRYTVLRGTDGVDTVVPNEMLMSNVVLNASLTDKAVRLSTKLHVAYQSDLDQMVGVIGTAVAQVARVNKTPQPTVHILSFGPDGIELEIGFWIDDPQNGKTNVLSDVNRAIWVAAKQAGIRIPYAERELKLTEQ